MKRSELLFSFLKIPVDLAMIVVAFALAYYLRTDLGFVPVSYVEPFRQYIVFILYSLPVWLLVFIFAGMYSLRNFGKFEEVGKVAVAVSAGSAILMSGLFLSKIEFFSRLIIIYVWILSIILVVLGRFLIDLVQRFFYRFGVGVHRVIILDGSTSSKYIVSAISKDKAYRLVRTIDEDAIDKLDKILDRFPADEIIIANPHINAAKTAVVLDFCRKNHLGFKMTPDLFLVQSSHVETRTLGGVPIMEFKRTPLDGWGRIMKKLLDIFGAIILIIITLPVSIISAILIKLTSKGPIIYKQKRIGYENKLFNFLKFRSMKIEYCTGENYGGKSAEAAQKKLEKKNEADGPVFKIKNDPRLTWFGKFMRKTSIDELPQFFNVLQGKMSLIGPRPPLPQEVEKYTSYEYRRLGIKPGITGLWQVSGRSDVSFDEWVRLDAYYIENWSLWLDFQIFVKTIWVVLKGRGAY